MVDEDLVFPARAGMSPNLSVATVTALRFPRTRGDEPTSGFKSGMGEVFSPHARG